MTQDVEREVKDRLVQQALLHQQQEVEYPSGTAVAVEKWVDGLELVMRHGHADQWIDLDVLVDEALPVGQLFA
jgi:hypothetical protein